MNGQSIHANVQLLSLRTISFGWRKPAKIFTTPFILLKPILTRIVLQLKSTFPLPNQAICPKILKLKILCLLRITLRNTQWLPQLLLIQNLTKTFNCSKALKNKLSKNQQQLETRFKMAHQSKIRFFCRKMKKAKIPLGVMLTDWHLKNPIFQFFKTK